MNARWSCDDARRAIDRALDGRAAPGEAERLEAHLRGCVPCREAARVARETAALFALERAAGPVPAPEGLAERVRSGLHGSVFRTTIWSEVLPTIRRLSAAAAVLAVASAGLVPFVGGGAPSPRPILALAARALPPADRYLLVSDAGAPSGDALLSLLKEVRR